jgi:hypothetical protein
MKRLVTNLVSFLVGFTAVLVLATLSYGFDVQLGWSHPEPDTVAEYRIYYGTEKGAVKTTKVPVVGGEVMEGEVLGLTLGTTYYFHITAINQYGYESGPSNEVWTDGTGEPGPGPAPDGCFIRVLLSREEVTLMFPVRGE